jgi:hypothetical protein
MDGAIAPTPKVIRTYTCKIVGWRVRALAHVGFVTDSPKQAVPDWRPTKTMALVLNGDSGGQYLQSDTVSAWLNLGSRPPVAA